MKCASVFPVVVFVLVATVLPPPQLLQRACYRTRHLHECPAQARASLPHPALPISYLLLLPFATVSLSPQQYLLAFSPSRRVGREFRGSLSVALPPHGEKRRALSTWPVN